MDQEAACVCRYKGRSGRGTAHLGRDELVFRGEFQLAIPLSTVRTATAGTGRMNVAYAGGEAIFELDEKTATAWVERISGGPGSPRS